MPCSQENMSRGALENAMINNSFDHRANETIFHASNRKSGFSRAPLNMRATTNVFVIYHVFNHCFNNFNIVHKSSLLVSRR